MILAKFFFWKSGKRLQKSLPGLRRGLLHDILKSSPELTSRIFPERWVTLTQGGMHIPTSMEISEDEVKSAFERLIEYQSQNPTHLLCLFIDGLDEFDDVNTHHDFGDLVSLLRGWITAAPATLKLCVSSRELNVFMNAFAGGPSIRLHDLTQRDMLLFIEDRLEQIPQSNKKDNLVGTIQYRSDGVFLWVAMVTQSMRNLFEDGASLEDLEGELNVLPDRLEDLFRHILRSLEKSKRTLAYQTLMILDTANENEIGVTLFTLSFLEQYRGNTVIFQTEREQSLQENTSIEKLQERMRKKLQGWCKGLIEVISHHGYLTFTHRSLAEFLQQPQVNNEMVIVLGHFNTRNAICELYLASLRYLNRSVTNDKASATSRERVEEGISRMLIMRDRMGMDEPPYDFLRRLDSMLETQTSRMENEAAVKRMDVAATYIPGMEHKLRDYYRGSTYFQSPLYSHLTRCCHVYPLWKLLHDPTVADSQSKASLLASLATIHNFFCMRQGMFLVLRTIFAQGIITVDTPTEIVFNYNWRNLVSRDALLSLWQNFLLFVLHTFSPFGKIDGKALGHMIEFFLEFKPDLRIEFSISNNGGNSPGHWPTLDFWFGENGHASGVLKSWPLNDPTTYTHGRVSLRAWIADLTIPNRDRILRMIDDQMAEQGSANHVGQSTSEPETMGDLSDIPSTAGPSDPAQALTDPDSESIGNEICEEVQGPRPTFKGHARESALLGRWHKSDNDDGDRIY